MLLLDRYQNRAVICNSSRHQYPLPAVGRVQNFAGHAKASGAMASPAVLEMAVRVDGAVRNTEGESLLDLSCA